MTTILNIPRAFIPKSLMTVNDQGYNKRVKYVYVTKCTENSRYPGMVMLEQYYHSNFATHQIITREELAKIDMKEKSDNAINLYNRTFHIEAVSND